MGVSVFLAAPASYPAGRCGHRPLRQRYVCSSVGADALIGPEADGMGVSVFSDRSGDAPRGAMWTSPPTRLQYF